MNLFYKCVSEFIGSLAIVFFGCGLVSVGLNTEDGALLMWTPVVFGLTVCAMIYAVGHISGAHFNPAVTFGFSVVGRFPFKQLPFYWLAQFLGATAGTALILILTPQTDVFAATTPAGSFSQSVIIEIILTFFLMFVIKAVATDSRAEGVMAGVAIGITVMICAFVGGPISGASMNPARSFGPALFQETLDTFWIYFVGPLIGAGLGAFAYKMVRCHDDSRDNKTDLHGCC